MRDMKERIADNLARIRQRMADAALASGRQPGSVRLLAVTKYAPETQVRALVEVGCHELGESRPQDLWMRAAALADCQVSWHFIGHLQRNKIRRTLPLVALVHSVDSQRLLDALEHESALAGRTLDVLLEINISDEPAKTGIAPQMVEPLVEQLGAYPHVRVSGLMGMAALEGDLARAEHDFERLRLMRDRLAAVCPPGVSLRELSMGMSHDFEPAIRQGATIVRIGSALFEELDAAGDART